MACTPLALFRIVQARNHGIIRQHHGGRDYGAGQGAPPGFVDTGRGPRAMTEEGPFKAGHGPVSLPLRVALRHAQLRRSAIRAALPLSFLR